jgi:branched-chain amino acid transport system substrate-binding protein
MEKKKKRWIWFSMVVLVTVAVLGYIFQDKIFNRNQDEITIVVVAPLTGKFELDGKDMLQGVQLYVDQINEDGGVNGKRLNLVSIDDQNNSDLAAQKAKEIVDEDKALVVIGHAFSSSSKKAAPHYEAAGIPAISGSATASGVTEGRDWYFRVIPNGRSQAVFTANYMFNIMGFHNAAIIYDTDAAGVSLQKPFEDAFVDLGGTIKYSLPIDTSGDVDAQVAAAVETLENKENGAIGAIFFATKVPAGIELVVQLRDKNIDVPKFGSSAFSNIDFIEGFKSFPREAATPGYYSNDFHAISPIIFDVAGRVGQDFRQDFLEKFETAPGMKAAANYDAVLVAVEAMKKSGISGALVDREADRLKIRDFLANIDHPQEAINGVTGNIFFDEEGNIVKSNYIGVYKDQTRISALTQLQPIKNLDYVSDLGIALRKGEVIEIDGQYMYKTDVVYTGIDLIEVSSLNTKNSTYSMDFYLWFRSAPGVDAKNIEFVNTVKEIGLPEPIAGDIIDREHYSAYRIKADFLGDFLFHDYPFDHQDMEIKFKHSYLTRDRMIYVIDYRGMELNEGQTALEKIKNSEDNVLNIGSWIPTRASFFQDIMTTKSTLGNPNFFGSDPTVEYSRFNALIEIERDTVSFGLKNLLPLLAVTILAYISAFLSIGQFAIKNAIGRGALMTVAFFHIKLSNDLPGIGYSVALDYVFYTMYVLIVVDLVVSVMAQHQHKKENMKTVARLTAFGKLFYPIVLIIGVIYFAYRFGLVNFNFF